MSQEEIELPRPLSIQLLHLAQINPDREICGLIGGRDGVPTSCYPVPNIDPAPEQRFHMDPKGQIAAMKRMREVGETLFAIFHSHPAAPAEPSPRDLEQAAYPDALYLIVSLNTKGVLEMRGFRLDDNGKMKEVILLLKHD